MATAVKYPTSLVTTTSQADAEAVTQSLTDVTAFGTVLSITGVQLDYNLTDRIQHENDTSNDDTYGLGVRIISGATVLAAATSGGAYEEVIPYEVQPNANAGVWTNLASQPSSITFGWVKSDATVAQWDSAELEYFQSYATNMGGDGGRFRMNAGTTAGTPKRVEVIVTYVAPATSVALDFTASNSGDILLAFISKTGTGSLTGPGGTWSLVQGTSGVIRTEIWKKESDGTETTVTWTGESASYIGEPVIIAAADNIVYADILASTANTGNSTTPSSPAVTPGPAGTKTIIGFGAENNGTRTLVANATTIVNESDASYVGHALGYRPTVGSWSTGGSFTTSRNRHMGWGSLSDMMIAGGQLSGGSGIDSVQEYNGSSWSAGTNMGASWYNSAAVGTSASSALRVAGYLDDGSGVDAGVSSFNGTSWSAETAATQAVQNHTGEGTETACLIFGGIIPRSFNGTTWTQEANQVSNLNHAEGGSLGYSQTSCLSVCGYYSFARTEVESWDDTSWSSETAYPRSAFGIRCSGSMTDGVSVGAFGETRCYSWDGTSHGDAPTLPSAVGYHAITHADVTVAGGYGASTVTNITYEYGSPAPGGPWTHSLSPADDWIGFSIQLPTSEGRTVECTTAALTLTTPDATVDIQLPPTPATDTIAFSSNPPKLRSRPYKKVFRGKQIKRDRIDIVGWAPTVSTDQPATDRTVEGTTEALALTANSATVVRGIDRTVACTSEALTLTANSATVTQGVDRIVACTSEALTHTTTAVDVDQGRRVVAQSEALSLTTTAATVQISRDVSADTEALALTANAATVTQGVDRIVTCTSEALTHTTNAVDVDQGRGVVAQSEALSLTTTAATVQTDRDVSADTEALLLTANAAALNKSREVAATTEALSLGTNATVVDLNRTAAAAPEALSLTTEPVDVSRVFNRTVSVATEALSLSTLPAGVALDRTVQVATEALSLTTESTTVFRGVDRSVQAAPEALALTASTTTVVRGIDRAVQVGTEALSLTAEAAAVFKGVDRTVQAGAEQLTLTTQPAGVDSARDVGSTSAAALLTTQPVGVDAGRLVGALTEAATLTTQPVGVDAAREAATSTEALQLTTSPVTVFRGLNRTVVATSEALALTANPAQVTKGNNRDVTCGTERLDLTTSQAQVQTDRGVVGTTEALTLTATTTDVGQARGVVGTTEALTLTATTTDVGQARGVLGVTEALSLTTNPAALQIDREVTGATEALSLTANAATVDTSTDRSVVSTTAALALTTTPATVDTSTDRVVSAAPSALSLTTVPGTVFRGVDRVVIGATEQLTLTTNAATVTTGQNRTVDCSTEALTLTALPATVQANVPRDVVCAPEALALTALPALVQKITVSNTLPWYGREGVVVKPSVAQVIVLFETDDNAIVLTGYGLEISPGESGI